MTPMWAANWKAMGQEEATYSRKRDMQSMLKGSGLTRVARIDTGLS